MILTYQLGNEALHGNVSAESVVNAITQQPHCTSEILIASITEILETTRNPAGIDDAIKVLHAVGRHLDRRSHQSCKDFPQHLERRSSNKKT